VVIVWAQFPGARSLEVLFPPRNRGLHDRCDQLPSVPCPVLLPAACAKRGASLGVYEFALHGRAAESRNIHEETYIREETLAAVVRGEWSPQPRVTQSHSIFNSNKQYMSFATGLPNLIAHSGSAPARMGRRRSASGPGGAPPEPGTEHTGGQEVEEEEEEFIKDLKRYARLAIA